MKPQGIIKKYKYSKIFLIILLPILFYGYYLIPYISNKIIWKDIRIDNLKIDNNGPNYKLTKGVLSNNGQERKIKFTLNPLVLLENDKILRLALFKQNLNENPLFVTPGVKEKELNFAVNNINNIHKDLVGTKKMSKNVIPVDFLLELPEVIRVYNNFSDEVSYKNADVVLTKQKNTFTKYSDEISNLKSILSGINLPNDNFVFNQAAAQTTEDIILKDLSIMQENQKALNLEIKERDLCLNTSILFCARTFEGPQSHKLNTDTKTKDINIIDKNDIQYQQYKDLSTAYGPYEVNSYCWYTVEKDKTKRYLYLVEKEYNGIKKRMPVLATEMYFHETTPKNVGKVISSQYKKHDIAWEAGKVGTTYTCNDLEYQPVLSTIDSYFKTFYGKDLLAFNQDELSLYPENIKKMAITGKELEKKFFSEKFPSENTLNGLSVVYRDMYKEIVVTENSKKLKDVVLPLQIKEDLIYRSNFIDGRLADFDKVLNFSSQTLNGFLQIDKLIEEKNNNSDYVYYMRNGYSLYYLNFSNAVWKYEDRPSYVDKEKSKMRADFIDYNEMIKRFGKEYVDKINSISRDQIWQEVLGYPIE